MPVLHLTIIIRVKMMIYEYILYSSDVSMVGSLQKLLEISNTSHILLRVKENIIQYNYRNNYSSLVPMLVKHDQRTKEMKTN